MKVRGFVRGANVDADETTAGLIAGEFAGAPCRPKWLACQQTVPRNPQPELADYDLRPHELALLKLLVEAQDHCRA